jgi:glycosyltransferase involved in cell wall biosynthesis
MRRRWLTQRAADAASVIFTDSEFSRREIEAHLGVPKSRIQVIAPGVASGGRRQNSEYRVTAEDTRQKAEGALNSDSHLPTSPRERLVLYAGSLFNRRRLPQLIAAFAKATGDMPDARLVIVGADRTWPPQDLGAVAKAYGVTSRVQCRHFVPEAELAALYAQASVFAFLSEYEGFGLTPLEAMAAGVPPVVLDTAVAREVYGDAAEYVGAGDVAGTAAALRRYLTSPDAREALVARAPAVLARYSWERAADRTLEHIERIAAR